MKPDVHEYWRMIRNEIDDAFDFNRAAIIEMGINQETLPTIYLTKGNDAQPVRKKIVITVDMDTW